jgi:hypothetical protein
MIKRAGRMMLHPLAQVCIGVFVAVGVSGRQLMMHILSRGKWRQREKKDDEPDRQRT